ncbi:hypothetical protein AC578_10066 [Pseudocercospora eumusae]|uniref:F-box domain-containing protein n=1 Tax=Pseudocercospora eumusae TaxID=321146 RepID=A0A139H893_9PEZI|nr:hypothetical protein AC578_10066 [Pseudocercospora eumusae]
MASNNNANDKFTALPLEMLENIAEFLGLWDRLKLRAVFPKNQEEVVVKLIGDALKVVHVAPNQRSLESFEHIATCEFFRRHICRLVYVPSAICQDSPRNGPRDQSPGLVYNSLKAYRAAHPALSRSDAAKSFDILRRLLEEYDFDPSINLDTLETEKSEAHVRRRLKRGLQKLPNITNVSILIATQSEGLNASCYTNAKSFDRDQIARGRNSMFADRLTAQVSHDVWWSHWQAFIWVMLDALKVVTELKELTLGGSIIGRLTFDDRFSCSYEPRNFRQAVANLTHLTIGIADIPDNLLDDFDHERLTAMAMDATAVQELTIYLEGGDWGPDERRTRQESARVERAFLQVGDYPQLRVLRIDAPKIYQDIDAKLFEQFVFRHRHVLQQVYLRQVVLDDKQSEDNEQPYGEKWNKCTGRILRQTLPEMGAWMRELKKFEMKLSRHEETHHQVKCFICAEAQRLAEELDVPLQDGVWDFGMVVMRSKVKYDSEMRVGDQN